MYYNLINFYICLCIYSNHTDNIENVLTPKDILVYPPGVNTDLCYHGVSHGACKWNLAIVSCVWLLLLVIISIRFILI